MKNIITIFLLLIAATSFAQPISGNAPVCQGSTMTLTDATTGGIWSSGNTTVATIGSTSGVVTGSAAGTANITYAVGVATVTAVVTVNVSPAHMYNDSVCLHQARAFYPTPAGGIWTTSNPAVDTIVTTSLYPSGLLQSRSAGMSTLTYTLPDGCSTTLGFRVMALPNPISGNAAAICPGSTIVLSDDTPGGYWVASGHISVGSATGIVTGISIGSSLAYYRVGLCSITTVVTVNAVAGPGVISGANNVATGSSITLSDPAQGGTWVSGNSALATVGSGTGLVTGVLGGTVTISYVVSHTCGTSYATKVISSNSTLIGLITGPAYICSGSPVSYSDATPGGTWSSSAPTVASVDVSGLVTGISQGTAVLSYTASANTTTYLIDVYSPPSVITGIPCLCPSNEHPVVLSNATTGGFWSTLSATIASVDDTGRVMGQTPYYNTTSTDTVTILYTTMCGAASIVATVHPNPLLIYGGGVDSVQELGLICVGATIPLFDPTPGGIWSCENPGIGSIDASGNMTGIAALLPGAIVAYTTEYGCYTTVDMNVLPAMTPISGTSAICSGGTVSLIDGSPYSHSWMSSNPAVATVGSSGVVTGISTGTATISFEELGTPGCLALTVVTVNPDAGTITGTAALCIGGTTPLSDAVGGGIWSSGSPGVATVGSSGIVTGVGTGTAIISYTATGSCGSGSATIVVTVSAGSVSAGTISGVTQLCLGGTTALTDGVAGGVWSTGASNVSVDGSGDVLGIAYGVATISYTVSGACGSATATLVVTVSPGVTAGVITGGTLVCSSGTNQLTDAVSGGVWSSGTPGVATVSASGLVTGVSLGTATISYTVSNSCGSSTAILVVTVSTGVSAGTITGTAIVCTGSTTNLTDAVSGGSWSSSNTLIASVSTAGVVVGLATGTATIYYTVSNSCGTVSANRVVTVNPSPSAGTITGTAVLCSTGTTTLSDAAAGGTWSSVTPGVATVGSTGIVTGVSAGTTIISYSVTNSCGTTVAATRVVTVNGAPNAGTITGTTTVCGGATTALTDAVTGGVWSSGTPAVATVSATGLVTGVSFGTTTISYAVTNSCGTATATTVVNVSGSSAGTITGLSTVITGTSISLTDAVSGGSWTASNGNATVSAFGLVTGVTPGTVTISYTVVSGCGSLTTTKLITVSNATSVSPISGYYFYMCTGATAAFWDATTGGSWNISPTSVATISAAGVATGMSAGTATISYTYGGSTVTAVVTVYATPSAITGANTICSGTTTVLSDATPGGTWSSSAVTIATISTAGLVTGGSTGTTTIYYTGAAGCRSSMVLTVTAAPSGIGGATSVCAGSSISLSDFTLGGTWSSTSGASVAATGSTTALATGITAGTATVTYSLGGSCYRTFNITVKVTPAPISGTLTVCTGSKVFLSDITTPGISWTSGSAAVATITASGAVTGVTVGTAIMTYMASSGCIATAVVTVNPTPTITAILGASSVSHSGGGITLSDLTGGGVWSSSNTAILTVGSASGHVTAVVSTGSAYINYIVTNSFGCSGAASKIISTSPAPHAHGSTTTVGGTVALADEIAAGDWTSTDNTIATVDGIVTALVAGTVNIIHRAGDVTTRTELLVNPLPLEVRLVPNPNKGTFTISGTVGTNKDEAVSIEISNMLGQIVYHNSTIATGGVIADHVLLSDNLANGMYLLNVRSGSESKVLHFVIEK